MKQDIWNRKRENTWVIKRYNRVNTLGERIKPYAAIAYVLLCVGIIILGKINVWADFILRIVLVLPDVFFVSYRIAKCVREITSGSAMGHFLTTNVFSTPRPTHSTPSQQNTQLPKICYHTQLPTPMHHPCTTHAQLNQPVNPNPIHPI